MSIQAMARRYVVLSIAVSYQQGNSRGQVSLWKMGRPGSLSTGRAGRNETCAPTVRALAGAVPPLFLLAHKNARPRVVEVCKAVPEHEGIDTIDCLSHSPDLNPTGYLWTIRF